MNSNPTLGAVEAPPDFRFCHGGADKREISGTIAALRRAGVDPGPFVARSFDERITVTGLDGQQWEVWGGDWCSLHAQRPKSADEKAAWVDQMNTRISLSFFSKDRADMCLQMAYDMWDMAVNMTPDKGMSREQRRALKKKLEVFALTHMDLMTREKLDMRELRQGLRIVGVDVPQVDHMTALQKVVH